jgi:hypothetical protein
MVCAKCGMIGGYTLAEREEDGSHDDTTFVARAARSYM